jgi:hypothetical protein
MESNNITKQITLNSIALCVFGMTLSSLLLPLVNISSTLPLAVMFAIVAIATIDSFFLRSQVATLFVDSIAGMSPTYRQRIIHHEAGHFLVAYLLNIPITDYTITAWDAWKKGQSAQGGVMFAPLAQNSLPAELLQRYCTVWMAGIAAEKLVYDRAEGGSEDRQKIRSVMAMVGKNHQDAIQQQNIAQIRAKSLIENHWEAYEALVKVMAQRTPVEDCCLTLAKFQPTGENLS